MSAHRPVRPLLGLALTGAALVLLLSFKTPADQRLLNASIIPRAGIVTPGPQIGPGLTAGDSPVPAGFAGASPPPAGPSATSSASGITDGTFPGSTAQTPFGPVQIQITISGGKITEVTALQLPSDRARSASIAAYAAPILRSEALAAQSAQIDLVSGATYTSEGYAQSLQAALDAAHHG